MTVRLRLQRIGRPKRPFYRLVAIDKKSKRDGKPIELLGQYDPMAESEKLKMNQERVDWWLKKGAVASETVAVLLKKAAGLIVSEEKIEKTEEPEKTAEKKEEPAEKKEEKAEEKKSEGTE
ncbi:MAG: 30S ribosomal protein S16 [Endomicrobiales bacterium]|nr:30S ribosomal protein S16 [Endomicrobiales bacterium]